jgi:hypothetical protein
VLNRDSAIHAGIERFVPIAPEFPLDVSNNVGVLLGMQLLLEAPEGYADDIPMM